MKSITLKAWALVLLIAALGFGAENEKCSKEKAFKAPSGEGKVLNAGKTIDESAGKETKLTESEVPTLLTKADIDPGKNLEPEAIQLDKVLYKENRAIVLLGYVDKVSVANLKRQLEIKVNGSIVKDVKIISQAGKYPIKLIVPLNNLGYRNNMRIKFGNSRNYDLDLGRAPIIVIESVYPREGGSGYYIHVGCEDYAEKYSWMRCEFPVNKLRESITVDPPVKFDVYAERRGFKLFGDFGKGRYKVKIKSGLVSVSGGFLGKDYETTVNVPLRTSKTTFAARGRYLPPKWLSQAPIKHLNVDEVKVAVYQVPEQNLVFWMSGQSEATDDRVAKLIGEKSFRVKNEEDVELSSWINLSTLVPNGSKGVFEFKLSGGSSPDSVRLSLTRLALIAKQAKNGRDMKIWAFDIETLKPENGVHINVLTKNNRSLASYVTGMNGEVVFKGMNAEDAKDIDKPFAIVASTNDDLTALKFEDLKISLTEFNVSGAPYKSESPYQGAAYMDRGVYRPGETARLVTVLWEPGDKAPTDAIPAVGRLTDPRGREILKISDKTNPAGVIAFELPFQDYASTGKYEFILEVGGKKVLDHAFHVEEFVPERMKVEVESSQKGVLPSETPSYKLNARYLFGAKASGERMEAVCEVLPGELKLENQPGYYFGVWRPDKVSPLYLGKVEKKLDKEGQTTFECPKPDSVALFKGPAKVLVKASVFEAGSGRTTVADAVAPVHPDARYVGLKSSTKELNSGTPVRVNGVVVDWEGDVVKESYEINLEFAMLQAEYAYEYDPDYGYTHWRRFLRETPVSKKKIVSKRGTFSAEYTPKNTYYGMIVRATAGEKAVTELYIKGEEYSYWWWGYGEEEDVKTPKPQTPEGLRIKTPEMARAGQTYEIKVDIPISGRMLFSVETDEILDSEWINVKAGEYTHKLKVDKFSPNIYVSALLVKDPFVESKKAFMPGRYFGVKSIKMDPEERRIPVKVSAPAEVKPYSEMKVKLDVGNKVKGPVFATVAAVDEGILQLTRFKTPDPLDDMFKKRALGVSTFETVGWTLLLPPPGEKTTTGGGAMEDGELGGGGRIQMVKPVALWSGLVEVGSDGKADIVFEVPGYRGQLRVMAVVATPDKLGSAETEVKVREPLVIQATYPRFLLANDLSVVPVFLTNNTGKDGDVKVDVSLNGEAVMVGSTRQSIGLTNGKSGVVTFLVKATGARGAVDFTVTATGLGQASVDQAEVPLIPNGPTVQEMNVVELTTGNNDLSKFLKGWDPQFEQTSITLTNARYIEEIGHLSYLVRYPYGCIEQTTSTTRPLLFISQLLPSLDPKYLEDGDIETKFMHGINRLFSMQTGQGGFSYWPGQSENTYWGTAYVTHTMLEGIEAGYPIDRDRVDMALDFMEDALTHNPDRIDKKYGYSVATSEPYMQYVLARAGRGRPKRVKNLLQLKNPKWGDIEDENRYLLKAALYISGDRTYEKDLKNPPVAINKKRHTGWTFWSSLRTRGMILNVMEDLFPGSGDAEGLAMTIADNLKQGTSRYYTTQELSWCVSGLGKRSGSGATSWDEPTLTMAGAVLDPLPKTGDTTRETVWMKSGLSAVDMINLKVDNIKGGSLFAFVKVEGMKPGVGYDTSAEGLEITRSYFDQGGNSMNLENLKLGDLVFVVLTLENKTGMEVKNIAMVDRLAAGFDVQNPRLNGGYSFPGVDFKDAWNLDYLNIRDDRVEMFGALKPTQKVVAVYAVRAVVGGKYSLPPATAEAMYDPRIHAEIADGKVTIKDPWDALTQ
jgi:alpha-2-macroglobulin